MFPSQFCIPEKRRVCQIAQGRRGHRVRGSGRLLILDAFPCSNHRSTRRDGTLPLNAMAIAKLEQRCRVKMQGTISESRAAGSGRARGRNTITRKRCDYRRPPGKQKTKNGRDYAMYVYDATRGRMMPRIRANVDIDGGVRIQPRRKAMGEGGGSQT
ncbi:hypothetical protein BC628DRAFT_497797 [Trametes gibbosa]|nr:hypothetical protein BC628DRAFT_497797 [Trametes gibbosa]